MIAQYAGLITLVGAIAIALIAWYIASRAAPEAPTGEVIPRLYRIRFRYFVVLVVILLAGFVATLPMAPYASRTAAPPDMVVDVTGHMWYWDLSIAGSRSASLPGDPVSIPAGTLVEFHVGSADVNHGFGLYDENGHLVAQTQAMPDYVNRLRYRFSEPGTYHVVCLEYCGAAHHVMYSAIHVE